MAKIKTFAMDYNGMWGDKKVNVVCFCENHGLLGVAKTAKMLAYIMKTCGMENETEAKHTDIYKDELVAVFDEMIDEATGIYNWEVNGVAG